MILRLKPLLVTLVDSKKIKILIPSEEEFGYLETLHLTLAFVKEIIDKLSGEEETTIDKILLLIRGLRAGAQKLSQSEVQPVSGFYQLLVAQIDMRFPVNGPQRC